MARGAALARAPRGAEEQKESISGKYKMSDWKHGTVALCLLGALTAAIPSALAQVPAAPPPLREMVDANGMDLIAGVLTATYHGPTIGPPEGSFGFTRFVRGTSVWDSHLGAVVSDGAGNISVIVGGETEKFTESGGPFDFVYTPVENNGAALAHSLWGPYTFTSRSGMVATFFERGTDHAHPQEAVGLLSEIVRPNGERITLIYTNEIVCEAYTAPNCILQKTAQRISEVTTSYGYKMAFGYPANTGLTVLDFFFLPTQVTLTNRTTGATVGSLGIAYSGIADNFSMSMTDALGRLTVYVIGQDGLSSIRYPGSASANITASCCTTGGYFWQVTNDGLVTNYSYTQAGSLTTTVTPVGHSSRVVTSSGKVLSDRDQLNRTTSYQYDAQARLSRVTAQEGNFAEYTYDSRGNLTQTLLRAKPGSGLADIITTAGFDATCTNPKTCNQPNWTRDAKNKQTDFTYDPTHGGVLTVTLAAPTTGAVRPQTRYAYSQLEAWFLNSSGVLAASGQPMYLLTSVSTCRTQTSCVGTSDEIRTTIGYGSAGVANNRWPVTRTQIDGTSTLTSAATMAYDLTGNLLTVDGPLSGTADTVRTRYDALRRVVGNIASDPDGAGGREPVAVRFTYDTPGNTTLIEEGTVDSQADGDWATFAALESESREYDVTGRPTKSVISGGGTALTVEQISYDSLRRPQCVAQRMNPAVFGSLPSSACSLGTQGSFGPDRITRRTYDSASQLTKITTGYASTAPIDERSMTYSANGLLALVADGRNRVTSYEYDGFDRLSKTYFPNPTVIDYEQRTYDANSNLLTLRARNAQTISFTVDDLNRTVLKDLPSGSSEDLYLSYDNHGRTLSARFGSISGAGVIDAYDGLGRLSTRTTFGRTLTYGYDAASRRTRLTHPDGYYADYVFNAADELTSVVDSTNTTLATFTYAALGMRTQISRGNSTTTSLTYDAISRPYTLAQDLSGTTHDGTSTFTTSPASQIASVDHTGPSYPMYSWQPAVTPKTMIYNSLNQLIQSGSTAVTHDTLANLATGESTYTYGYDIDSRMRSAVAGGTTVSLYYDPLGMLNEVTTNGTTTKFLYDGPDLVAEYNSAGTVLRRYVHGGGLDEPLVWYEGSGTSDRRYFHADERGSIQAISNNAGAGTMGTWYSPYGESASPASSRFGFTGQVFLPDPGVYYYKSRMYSAKVGRFLQPDAIGYAGGMNLYAYVGGDPVNHTDPLGLTEGSDPQSYDAFCFEHPDMCDALPGLPGSISDRDIDASDAQERARQREKKLRGRISAVQCSMEAPFVSAESKMGAFAELTVNSAIGKVHLNFDAASVNQPTTGENYLSQGFNVEVRILTLELGFGVDRRAPIPGPPGKPAWERPRVLFGWNNLSLSNDGLDFSIGGGIFIGSSVATAPIKCKTLTN